MNIRIFRKRAGFSFLVMAVFIVFFSLLSPGLLFSENIDEPVVSQVQTEEQQVVKKWAFISAAVAFGLGAVGAALAISNVGAAAMGAMSEKPEIGSQALIFIALAEGLVVFGFITALMILSRI